MSSEQITRLGYLSKIKYPIAGDGYAVSVSPEDEQVVLDCLDRFGLVVVPVLSADERASTLEAFFREANEEQRPTAVEKLSLDPLTWGNENWPNKSQFLVRRRPTVAYEPTLVRTHPRVHRVFAALFGTDELVTSIDRWGVMRGTARVPTRQFDGSVRPQDRPDWRQHLALHWDANPGQQAQRYQALVAILDNPIGVGGFRAVLGSHHFFSELSGTSGADEDVPYTGANKKISSHDPLQKLSQKIPVRAGDMIVFDSRLLHGTFENKSPSMRLVQYVRMMPKDMTADDDFSATNVLERHPGWRDVLESYPLDDRSRRLLGLDKYT